MAEAEQAIPEDVIREARELARFMPDFTEIARALMAAESRGRAAQREADAWVAQNASNNWAFHERNETRPGEKALMKDRSDQAARIATTIRNS